MTGKGHTRNFLSQAVRGGGRRRPGGSLPYGLRQRRPKAHTIRDRGRHRDMWELSGRTGEGADQHLPITNVLAQRLIDGGVTVSSPRRAAAIRGGTDGTDEMLEVNCAS